MGLIARTLVKIRKAKKEREEKEIRHALLARNKANKETARHEALEQARKEKAQALAKRKAIRAKAGPSDWEKLGKGLLKFGKSYAKNMAERDRAAKRTSRPNKRKKR